MKNLTIYKSDILENYINKNISEEIVQKMSIDETILEWWNNTEIMDELEACSGMMESTELEMIQYYLWQVTWYSNALYLLKEEFEKNKIEEIEKEEMRTYTTNDMIEILNNLLK